MIGLFQRERLYADNILLIITNYYQLNYLHRLYATQLAPQLQSCFASIKYNLMRSFRSYGQASISLIYKQNFITIQMKDKSVPKKIKPTPVVLIDQSPLAASIAISRMINPRQNSSLKPSNNLGGGFKYRPEQKTQQQNNASSKILANLASKLDKVTVYDEFGLINSSIGKSKYRQPAKPSQNDQFAQSNIKAISSENPWQKTSKEPINNNFVDANRYELIKSKEREQVAFHVKSSLQQINLQNIEAKLEAHRQSMRPIEQQYNISRGKSMLMPEKQKPALRFNVDIDKEFKQTQPQQIYELIKERQEQIGRPEEDVTMEEMWEQRKKKDPKLAEYDLKYQQFLVEKEAKKIIGTVVRDNLFTWDKYALKEQLDKRKMTKKQKSKEKSYGHINQQSNVITQSPQRGHATQPEQIDIAAKIASKDDKFISKFVLAEIDVDKRGTVSKDQLVDYLSRKDHLIKGYHIDLKWLHSDLDNFETKRKGMLSQNQIAQFLATLDAVHHPPIILKEVSKGKDAKNKIDVYNTGTQLYVCYFKQHRKKFQRVFQMLDISDDRIIKRQEFLENVFVDTECTNLLEQTAIQFNVIGKSISFRQILALVLDDYRKQKNEKLKKAKEYITFQRFEQYFEVPDTLDLSKLDRDGRDRLKGDRQSAQIDIYDIEEEYLGLLKDICSTVPRVYQDYLVTSDFIAFALRDPQILAFGDEMCRIQSNETGLPVESIKSVLQRMTKECDEYATWQILKTYFSRRGRPLDLDLELINKKKEIRQQKLREGADLARSKIPQAEDRLFETSKSKLQMGGKSRDPKIHSIDKYTIPEPFKITDELKKKGDKKMLSTEELQIQEMQKKFKARPINKQIFESKPDLIQGKLNKSDQKSNAYNYEDYQNDRIERVLKKAQLQFDQAQQAMQIKKMTQVKAKDITINLDKKWSDVIKEQNEKQKTSKPKPTVPEISSHLYPENPQDDRKRKIQKIKQKQKKIDDARKAKANSIDDIKKTAKDKNDQARKMAAEQKKREEEQNKNIAKLDQNPYKPKITPYNLTEQEKQANRKNKEDKKRKQQQEIQKILDMQKDKKQNILNYQKKQNKLSLEGLEDEEILNRIDEIDLEDILLDQQDKQDFRKEYAFKDKTRKEIKDRISGLAGRERAAMEAEDKRLAEEKRKLKEQKQDKAVKQKIDAAKERKENTNGALNMDTNFHRSNALRRYRALMEGKQAPSQYDKLSRGGDPEKEDKEDKEDSQC